MMNCVSAQMKAWMTGMKGSFADWLSTAKTCLVNARNFRVLSRNLTWSDGDGNEPRSRDRGMPAPDTYMAIGICTEEVGDTHGKGHNRGKMRRLRSRGHDGWDQKNTRSAYALDILGLT